MPRTIQADGRTITVPDDATPDEINQIVGPAPKSAASAQPSTFDKVRGKIDQLSTVTPEEDARHSLLTNQANHFGAGVIGSTAGVLNHPIKTVENMAHSATPDKGLAGAGEMLLGPAGPMAVHTIESLIHDPAQTLGGVAGGTLLGDAGGEVLSRGAGALSEPLQAGGAGLVDRAAGTLKTDFAHGAQPGRGYLEGGGTPALTMRGLANKAETVKGTAGEGLGKAYDAATDSGIRIPAKPVSDALLDPAYRLRATQNAPGGLGESPSLDEYESRLTPHLSSQPDFSPREVFDLKRNVAANTRWNDPTMFDMNSVRQQGVGGVGKLLTDAVPETAPLNRVYQGSGNLADRATLRADTGTPPFASIVNRGLEGAAGAGLGYMTHNPFLAAAPLLMDSVPVKTGAGYMLFHAGKAAGAVPNPGLIGAGATSPLLLPQGSQ